MMTMEEARAKLPAPWTKEQVLERLHKSRKFVEHAILALHHAQSPEQQDGERTDAPRDRVGFNRWDKENLLGDYARQLDESTEPDGHRLTDRQLYFALVKLRPYARQLADMANRNAAEMLLVEARRKEVERVINPCPTCYNAGIVVRTFLGKSFEEPCPTCGDTPYSTVDREGPA